MRMIGQSIIAIKSGGRGRLVAFAAGVFLLSMVVFAGTWVKQIPMAALVAVMIMVSIGTFSWSSIRSLKKNPLSSSIVMVSTVAAVVATHNLAIGVLIGVLLSSLFFANKISRIFVVKSHINKALPWRIYKVIGQVFYASADRFTNSFDFKEALERVTIDLSEAHFWDVTSVYALDKVVIKFRREGVHVEIIGMNEASATIVDQFGVHDKPEEVEKLLAGH